MTVTFFRDERHDIFRKTSAILMPHAQSLLRLEEDSPMTTFVVTTIAGSLEWHHLRVDQGDHYARTVCR